MRLLLLASIVALSALLQGGCRSVRTVDVSSVSAYNNVIGREYLLKNEFMVYFIKFEPGSTRQKYYTMIPRIRISGPEIVKIGPVPKGSRIRIVGVKEQQWILFPSRVEYEALFVGADVLGIGNERVRIYREGVPPVYLKSEKAGSALVLNEEYFTPL
jgi:hypothetical protein